MGPFQGTLAKSVKFEGIGLHKGQFSCMQIDPVRADTGIWFVRTDLVQKQPILACPGNILSTNLCTTIGHKNGARISTIEHLMAAFVGLGIDNAIVSLNSDEVPIMDGSSLDFVKRFEKIGVIKQNRRRKCRQLLNSCEVVTNDQFIKYDPLLGNKKSLTIDCTIDFPENFIGRQQMEFELTRNNFLEIYKARTFCQYEWIKKMREQGCALGGSLQNAVVVDKDKVLNKEGLRYSDEFVRHKILDCIGDLALLGFTLCGRLTVYKGGHTLHALFVKKIWEYIESFEVLSLNQDKFFSFPKCKIS